MASLEESTTFISSSIFFSFSSTCPTIEPTSIGESPSTSGNLIMRPRTLASKSLLLIFFLEQARLQIVGLFYFGADALKAAPHLRPEVGQLTGGGGIGGGFAAG